LGNRDPFTLNSHELLSLFSYRFTADTQKKRRQEALKRLKEEFDDDLNAQECVTDRFPMKRKLKATRSLRGCLERGEFVSLVDDT